MIGRNEVVADVVSRDYFLIENKDNEGTLLSMYLLINSNKIGYLQGGLFVYKGMEFIIIRKLNSGLILAECYDNDERNQITTSILALNKKVLGKHKISGYYTAIDYLYPGIWSINGGYMPKISTYELYKMRSLISRYLTDELLLIKHKDVVDYQKSKK